MRKVPLKDIAAKAGVSVRTVFRVLNGDEHVKAGTYRHTSGVLSQYGYSLKQGILKKRIVIYGNPNRPLTASMISKLQQSVLPEEYAVKILPLDSSLAVQRSAFEEADITILFSNPTEDFMRKLKGWNPGIFRIVACFGYVRDAELVISENHQGIGQCAADYLCGKMNYPSVYAFLPRNNASFAERVKAFAGQVLVNYPEVKLHVFNSNGAAEDFDRFFESEQLDGAGMFIPGCVMAREFIVAAMRRGLEIPRDLGLVACDNPHAYLPEEQLAGLKIPTYIEFHSDLVMEWLLYYLKYTPRNVLMPAVTYLPYALVENGSAVYQKNSIA